MNHQFSDGAAITEKLQNSNMKHFNNYNKKVNYDHELHDDNHLKIDNNMNFDIQSNKFRCLDDDNFHHNKIYPHFSLKNLIDNNHHTPHITLINKSNHTPNLHHHHHSNR